MSRSYDLHEKLRDMVNLTKVKKNSVDVELISCSLRSRAVR